MATKKRGLGKGLDALLGQPGSAGLAGFDDTRDELRAIPVDLLQRSPYQPRQDFPQDSLQELADSIRAQGVVQPIVVRPVSSGTAYEIIAGERRWRAAQLAGLHEVPAVIRRMDDQSALCMALIENIQREDLNPLEQARALSRLMAEFDMTHDAIADAIGRSRSAVTNLLRLLDLSERVRKLLEQGALEMGHARAMLTLPADSQLEVALKVAQQGLSVRATEALVRRLQSKSRGSRQADRKHDPDIVRLETDLSERLGAGVSIKHSKSGKGMLQISYNSLNELDGILSRIK